MTELIEQPADAPQAVATLSRPPSPDVLAAAQQIRALHSVAVAVSEMIRAQVMEALWAIRQEYPDDQDFRTIISAYTPLKPREAMLMAETWRTARTNRELRELAQSRPQEAMRFVSRFLDAGLEDRLEALSEGDTDVARILALPPRKRAAEIRRLVSAEAAVQEGLNPAARERIRTLEAERDAAVEDMRKRQAANVPVATAVEEMRRHLRDIREAEERLRELRNGSRKIFSSAADEGLELDAIEKEGEDLLTTITQIADTVDGIYECWLEVFAQHESAPDTE